MTMKLDPSRIYFRPTTPHRTHDFCNSLISSALISTQHIFISLQVGAVNQVYPGRASMAPLLDLLMTLLHWGAAGNISLTSNDLAI